MKKLILILLSLSLLLASSAFAVTTTHTSFTITSAAAADIAMSGLETAFPQENSGASTSAPIGKAGGSDRRFVLRFEKLLDSLRVRINSDTGTWTIDSGRTILNCASALQTNDSVKVGMIRLKSGRAFVEGIASASTGYGVTHDSCVAKYNSANTGIDWTTNGAQGANDTTGGIIDSTALLSPALTVINTDISWKLRTVDLADTTNFSGWLFFAMWYGTGTTTPTTQQFSFDSDDATDATERPVLKVYLTNVKNTTAATTSPRRRKMLIGQVDSTAMICEYEEEMQR